MEEEWTGLQVIVVAAGLVIYNEDWVGQSGVDFVAGT